MKLIGSILPGIPARFSPHDHVSGERLDAYARIHAPSPRAGRQRRKPGSVLVWWAAPSAVKMLETDAPSFRAVVSRNDPA